MTGHGTGRFAARFAAGIATSLLAVALSGCGGGEAEAPAAATQRGIDRSVADIRAAEAATRGPVEVSRSVGELTGKQSADAEGAEPTKAGSPKAPASSSADSSPANSSPASPSPAASAEG